DDGSLVTVGLTPTRPETGYGYLELDEALAPGLHAARRFVEKPDRRRAEQFIATGQFLWNSGMFFFRADAILRAISTHLPSLASAMQRFDEAATRGEEADVVAREYGELPSVSIDHGVMEKSSGVKVAVGDFEWSDLGSWATAYELSEKGAGENAFEGDVLAHNAKRNLVRAPEGKVVALVGVDDLVVVDTGDALLITPREGCQDVREIVAQLRKRNDNRL
ncbi:MAG: sugar phosphate nucleotidyltransferase, partial [Myxococcota bacterium]